MRPTSSCGAVASGTVSRMAAVPGRPVERISCLTLNFLPDRPARLGFEELADLANQRMLGRLRPLLARRNHWLLRELRLRPPGPGQFQFHGQAGRLTDGLFQSRQVLRSFAGHFARIILRWKANDQPIRRRNCCDHRCRDSREIGQQTRQSLPTVRLQISPRPLDRISVKSVGG